MSATSITAPTTYGTVTKVFHWLTAALILAIIPLGIIATDMGFETNEQLARKAQLFTIHKTLGVAVFVVALLRILWAVSHAKPGPLHPERRAETLLAETVHWLLYASLVITPLSGWIGHAATTGFAPIWWPFSQSLPFVPKDDGVAHLAESVHWVFGKVMIATLLLHIAGALKHHLIDRDATLRRMWFGRTATPQVGYHRTTIAAPLAALLIVLAGGGTAIALGGGDAPEAETAALETVASDWTVQEGTLSIGVTQFGSTVTGSFTDWTAAIAFDPEATDVAGEVTATIAIGSLTLGSVTDQAMGADFFDAATHPTATFTAPITRTADGYVADGTLTLKGQTAPLSLPFTLTLDGDTATMQGQTTLDRLTWGIGQTMADETNLGFGVTVEIALTATRAP
ncbi:Cytochrome b561 [Loktanella fryxellensis]|uniref:Cytochrome b561 n=1 Tax=Loktanella fryxellensis TaxID=245187 RepID=A0A1H7YDZ6_9RHOB|nr:cytochrome b/b6 domain-containing protein [Loktanella fryxellensis]SEM44350.1 Cytochrome b561 [Loktanella fryxellensis]